MMSFHTILLLDDLPLASPDRRSQSFIHILIDLLNLIKCIVIITEQLLSILGPLSV